MSDIPTNRQRTFTLPRVDQLTKDQEEARALPLNGQHLVIGGPGTGKSVVALMRAMQLARIEKNYQFLVYNRLLNWSGGQLVNGLKKSTWESWFRAKINQLAGKPCPLKEADKPGGYQEIDWEAACKICQDFEADEEAKFDHLPFLVIDEGQDMPPEFYRSLFELSFENFYVVADQNQRITKTNSSRDVLMKRLLIDREDVLELKTNFRNCYPTAALARYFCPEDRASPKPELPPESRSAEAPILFEYAQKQVDQICRRILLLVDRDPKSLIAVITPNHSVREQYVRKLRNVPVSLDNHRCRIQTYGKGQREEVRFDEGGIIVINQQSCKGLEFDVVILADIDKYWNDQNDPDDIKRRFYVMISRSKGRVILLREKSKTGAVDELLPDDERILQRWPK